MKMKLINIATPFLIVALIPLLSPVLSAEETGDKEHKHSELTEDAHAHLKAPNGGRLITGMEPHAEFLVTPDRKIRITFINDDGKVVAPGDQKITVTVGDRSKPTKLTFAKDGDGLISDGTLPKGENMPAIMAVKSDGAKPFYERFQLNLADCPTCKFKEYACICAHGDHAGHDH